MNNNGTSFGNDHDENERYLDERDENDDDQDDYQNDQDNDENQRTNKELEVFDWANANARVGDW